MSELTFDLSDEAEDSLDSVFTEDSGDVVGPVLPAPREGRLPLAWQQESLWFLHQLNPDAATYHLPVVLRLHGPLDLPALEQALTQLITRHEGLRTRFAQHHGQPHQLIDPAPASLRLPEHPVTSADWHDQVHTEINRPYDLEQGAFRYWLGHLDTEEHILVLTSHHIITDGWSTAILMRELDHYYSHPADTPQPLTVQPTDYALWQHQHYAHTALPTDLDYWQRTLAELPDTTLPSDHPRPAQPTNTGAHLTHHLDPTTGTALAQLATQTRSPLLAVLLAGYLTVLHRYTDQDDLTIGSVFSGRTRPELQPILGLFANAVVLRTNLEGNPTLTELIHRCRDTVLGALQHQDAPFHAVVDTLHPHRHPNRIPLFQTCLTLATAEGAPTEAFSIGDLDAEPIILGQAGVWIDLRIELARTEDGGFRIFTEYSTDMYEQQRVVRLLEHLTNAWTAMVADPDQRIADVPLMSPAEQQLVTVGFNDTDAELDWQLPVPQLLARSWRDYGSQPALCYEGEEISYAELGHRVQVLASRLAQLGVRRGSIVGVCARRSIDLVVALVATMTAGAAYLPLDPDLPEARLQFQIEDGGAQAVLYQPDTAALVPSDVPGIELNPVTTRTMPDGPGPSEPVIVSGADAAYVIYTSGSTGRPKGVVVPHRGLTNRLAWMQDCYGLDRTDSVVQKTPFGFDVSVWEFFWPLMAGARLVLAKPNGHRDFGYLAQLMRDQHVTVAHFVPSVLGGFLAEPAAAELPELKRLFCSGEALSADVRDSALRSWPQVDLNNLYGPTEASIDVTAWRCGLADGTVVPIGKPIANIRCYVLDRNQRAVPIGIPGQLYLAGVGLATGYLNRPDLTSERFPACPFGAPGERMYATGDIARWRADGNLEYLGRDDGQIKLHGLRIELGEIEHALTGHPDVQAAAVALADSPSGEHFLAAYLVPASHTEPDQNGLRAYLADRLPLHMLPATFTILDTFPLSNSGKLDRKALPAPLEPAAPAPATATHHALAGIWQDLLNSPDTPNPHSNFFTLGGSSLLGVQVLSRVREVFGVELPLQQLFLRPVLADLAAAIDEHTATADGGVVGPVLPTSREGRLPLAWQQESLWFLHQLDPDSATYHLPLIVRLRGPLDRTALEHALLELITRHVGLRTRFTEQHGQPHQLIDPPPATLRLPEHPVTSATLTDHLRTEVQRPFDLEHGAFRYWLGHLDIEDHVLILTSHHIITDGWSAAILLRELDDYYAHHTGTDTRSGTPEPLAVQPTDYARWQHQHYAHTGLPADLRYWQQALADLPDTTLPSDHPRPAQPTGAGANLTRHVDPTIGAPLAQLATQTRSPLLAVLLAGYLTVLHRYTDQDDLTVGSVFSGRTRPELQPVLGLFANAVVLRTNLQGNPTLTELIHRCRDTVLGALQHQDAPFHAVVDTLNPDRYPNRNPLFQTCLTLTPLDTPTATATSQLTMDTISTPTTNSRFDITINITPNPDDSLDLFFEYSTELFDEARIRHLADDLETAWTSFASTDPAQPPAPDIHHHPAPHTTRPLAPAAADLDAETDTATATATQHALAVIWHELLATPGTPTPHTNFFTLGGSSLLGVQVLSRVREVFGVELELRQLFLRPMLADLAAVIDERAGAATAQGIDQLDLVGPVLPAGRDGLLPLAWQQESLWFLHRLNPEAATYHLPVVLRLRGPLDIPALARALALLIARHEGLRTRFTHQHGQPHQLIDPAPATVALTETPLTATLADHLSTEVSRPFNLEQGAFRYWLGYLDAEDHVLVLTSHHIITDGWSTAILTRELGQYYAHTTGAGTDQPLPLAVQPTDYALWQHRQYAHSALPTGLRYWQRTLADLPDTTLPSDRPRPVRPTGAGASLTLRVDPDTGSRLTQLATQTRSPLLAVLLAGYLTVLHRYTDQDDLTVGSISSGRTRPELQPVLGLFANAVVLRTNLQGNPTLTELIHRCRDTVLGALQHQDVPFQAVVDAVNPHRHSNRNPLFQTCLTLSPHDDTTLASTALSIDTISTPTTDSRFDITITVTPNPDDSLDLFFEYSTELFDEARIRHLADDLETAWTTFASTDPDQPPATHNIHRHPAPHTTGPLAPASAADLDAETDTAPATATQHALAVIWHELLATPSTPTPHTNFFTLGGSSLDLARFATATTEHFGVELELRDLYLAPTIAAMAELVDQRRRPATPETSTRPARARELITLREAGTRTPLFLVHAVGGSAVPYLPLVELLADDLPVHALEADADRVQRPTSIVELADRYLAAIRDVQPAGRYRLAGWSVGGVIAHEMAVRLRAAGEEVSLVALFDSVVADRSTPDDIELLDWFAGDIAATAGHKPPDLDRLGLPERPAADRVDAVLDTLIAAGLFHADVRAELRRRFATFSAIAGAFVAHRPRVLDRPIEVLAAAGSSADHARMWQAGTSAEVHVRTVPGSHYTMVHKPNLERLADELNRLLDFSE